MDPWGLQHKTAREAPELICKAVPGGFGGIEAIDLHKPSGLSLGL